MRRPPLRLLMLAGVVALGVGFRLWGLGWGLENSTVSLRPHPDEWPVYWVFRWFDRTRSLNPCPQPGHSCFFDWGAVYLMLAYGAHTVLSPVLAHVTFGPKADPYFIQAVLAGRLLSALASTLTVIGVYGLAATLYGRGVALLAALLVAVSGLLIQLAHFATPDSTTVLLMTLALLATARAMQLPSRGRFLVAGAAAGLATGTEYHMALLALPVLAAWLLAGRPGLGHLAYAAAGAGAAAILSNPYALLELQPFAASLWHTVRIRTVDSQAEYQRRFQSYGPALLFVVRYALGYGVGAALTGWLAAGAGWAALRRQQSDLLLLAWIIPYFLLVTLSPAKFVRYSAPLLPPLAVLASRLGADVWRARPVRPFAFAAAAVAVSWTAAYDGAYAGLFSSTDPRAVAMQWLDQHAAAGSRVAVESLPTGLVNLPYFVSAAGFQPCILEFWPRRLNGPARYLVTDAYSLEEHPRIPGRRVARFQRRLENDPSYRLVANVHYVPVVFGLRFPIDGSPHDWRYPARTVSIYQKVGSAPSSAPYCFPSAEAASAALYTASGGR